MKNPCFREVCAMSRPSPNGTSICYRSWDISTSGLAAAILGFRCRSRSDVVGHVSNWLADPINMGFAVGTARLSVVEAEIPVLPVWRPPFCILASYMLWNWAIWLRALLCQPTAWVWWFANQNLTSYRWESQTLIWKCGYFRFLPNSISGM
jgi:hypothetical protein